MNRFVPSSFLPIPAALMTVKVCCGSIRLLPADWLGISCSRPALLSAAFRAPVDEDAWSGDFSFTVNLPGDELLKSRQFIERLAEGAVTLSEAGLTEVEGTVTGLPLIAECPVRIECIGSLLATRFSHKMIQGEVVAVHTDKGHGRGLFRFIPHVESPRPRRPSDTPEISRLTS